MERKRYRFIWWILAVILLIVIIWYAVAKNRPEEYTDGTLVWNPSHTFCMNSRNYCSLSTIARPFTDYGEKEGTACQKPFI